MKRKVMAMTIRAKVPFGMNEADVRELMESLIGEAVSAASDYVNTAEYNESADLREDVDNALASDFDVCAVVHEDNEGTDLECRVDVDDACYCGDENDGVYYQAFEDDDGKWWLSAIVDSDSGAFVDTLIDADGPYNSEDAAERAGRAAAEEWCGWNDVAYCSPEPGWVSDPNFDEPEGCDD